MRSGIRHLALVLLTLAASACASAAVSEEGATRRDARRIAAEEIATAGQMDAYLLVRNLRPAWLRRRGGGGTGALGQGTQSTDIAVFLDNVKIGDPESLREIPLNTIRSLEYVDAMTATQRWGTGYPFGAILVHTR